MPAKGRICGEAEGPTWCEAPVFSRGLCRRHYRRAAKGLPITDPEDSRRVGVTPSGHGTYGVVDVEDGKLLCHECGGWYRSLAVHIGMAHDGTRAYRLAHGLTMSTPLVAEDVSAAHSEVARAHGSAPWLAGHRTPDTLAGQDQYVITRGIRLRHARP